jgi:hypothetical protein
MDNPAWIALLRRIPPAQHDNLMIVTSIGTEVTVQTLMRFEDDYLVLRGRMSGTTDAGRIFFLPYDQINHVGFVREVKEVAVHALYDAPAPEPAAAPAAPADATPAAPAATNGQPPAAPASEPPPGPPREQSKSRPRLVIPSKEALLERLRRTRGQADAAGPASHP